MSHKLVYDLVRKDEGGKIYELIPLTIYQAPRGRVFSARKELRCSLKFLVWMN